MNQKISSVLVVLITVAVVMVILQTEPEPRLVQREAALPSVLVTQLRAHDVQPWQKFIGWFEPVRTSELTFEVPGRIVARYVEAGELVEKGRVLLKIDDWDYRDALEQVQAEVNLIRAEISRDEQLFKLARDNVQLQEREVSRLKSLVAMGLSPQSSLDAARQQLVNLQIETSRVEHLVSTANARLELIRSKRDQVERELHRTELRAPFAGVVNQVEAEVGGYAITGQTALVLVDVSAFDLLLYVDEEVVSTLEPGMPVTIEQPVFAMSSIDLQGELVSLQVAPDPETFTYEARIRVAAHDGLRAGMVASAYLPRLARDNVLTVPIGAVQYIDGQTYVFVEYDGALKRTRVVLGARVGNDVIIRSGIEAGLNVIVEDVDKLYDGQKVAVRRGEELIR